MRKEEEIKTLIDSFGVCGAMSWRGSKTSLRICLMRKSIIGKVDLAKTS